MKTLKEFLNEDFKGDDHYRNIAKGKQFERMKGLASSVGSFASVRKYKVHQPGGGLETHLYGDYDLNGRHHEFAYKSSYKGRDTFAHTKFSNNIGHRAPNFFPDKKELENHILKQNPHLKGTGHAAAMAHHIHNEHGEDDV